MTNTPVTVKPEVEEYFEAIKDIDKYQELPCIDINPFMATMINGMMIKKDMGRVDGVGRAELVDKTSGEIVETTTFYTKKIVDADTFVKIYSNRLKDLFDLSKTAIKVFFYFIDQMNKPYNINTSMILIDIQECVDYCDYSANTQVYAGLIELVKAGIIAKAHRRNLFHIDPNTVFNGNRMMVMEEYIKKEADYFDDKSLSR